MGKPGKPWMEASEEQRKGTRRFNWKKVIVKRWFADICVFALSIQVPT